MNKPIASVLKASDNLFSRLLNAWYEGSFGNHECIIFFGKKIDVLYQKIFLLGDGKKVDSHQFLIGKFRRGIVAFSLAGILQLHFL